METPPSRICQRPGCHRSLEHLRADARYCSTTCKREAARARAGSIEREQPKTFRWSAAGAAGARARRRGRQRYAARAAASVVALIVLLAGCGGSHHCQASDYAMQCALQKLHAPRMLLLTLPSRVRGIDFAWSCPSPTGFAFGASYGSPDASKNWSASCLRRWHAAGKATVSVWESAATRAQDGYNAGFRDARAEASILASDGAPPGQPFDMAVDCDCQTYKLVSYFQGANAAEPGRINAYGGYWQIKYLHDNHLVGNLNWQTYAWSGGLWLPASVAPLEQYLNGSSVDYDRALAPIYGQWPAPASAPKPKPKPKPARCLHRPFPRTSHCRIVRYQYDRLQRDIRKLEGRLRQHHCSSRAHPSYCRGWQHWLPVRARQAAAILHHNS